MDKLYEFSDYIKKCPNAKGIINWWELHPDYTIVLKPEIQRIVISKAVEQAGGYLNLSNKINLSLSTLYNLQKMKRMPSIGTLLKVIKFTKQKPYLLNTGIIEIASLKNPKLPFYLKNSHGAEVMAAFFSDGHLPKNIIKNPMYCASERELHFRLISLCKYIFGDFNVHIKKGHNALLTRFPCPIGNALTLAGVPQGDKRRKNPFLPKMIINGNLNIQTSYLRRAFDDEGDVVISKSKRAIRLTRSIDTEGKGYQNIKRKGKWTYGIKTTQISNLILGEYLLLKKLGIDARLYREGIYQSVNNRLTAKWRIQIAQQDNLKLFANKIGFNYYIKKKKLNKLIKSYKRKKSPNGVTEKIIWDYINYLSKRKKVITFKDIGKKLNSFGMTYDFAGKFLRKFIKENKMAKIKRGKYIVKSDY